MMISIKKPVSVLNLDEYRLLFIIILTVGRAPTLSAERITFRASSPAATLGERMSKYKRYVLEIAQFPLGDLALKIQHPPLTYSSAARF